MILDKDKDTLFPWITQKEKYFFSFFKKYFSLLLKLN